MAGYSSIDIESLIGRLFPVKSLGILDGSQGPKAPRVCVHGSFVEKPHDSLRPLENFSHGTERRRIGSNLAKDWDVACDDMASAGHCLNEGKAKPFGLGRLQQERGAAINGGQDFAAEERKLQDAAGDPQSTGETMLRFS